MERSQEQWKLAVPQEFWQPKNPRPKCFTVGELREQLTRLPDDLPLGVVGSNGTSLAVHSLDTFEEENCRPQLVLECSYDDEDEDDWDADDTTWMESDDDEEDDDDDFWDDNEDDWGDDDDDWDYDEGDEDDDEDDEDEEDW